VILNSTSSLFFFLAFLCLSLQAPDRLGGCLMAQLRPCEASAINVDTTPDSARSASDGWMRRD
jgi:hypothetical protein